LKGFLKEPLLISEQEVEECDANEAAQGTKAGNKNIKQNS